MNAMRGWLTGLSLLALPLAAVATDNASYWLQRISAAMQHLSYEGTFVYAHDGEMESIHIIHGADENGEHERLIALSGPAREVIRDKDNITYVLPDDLSVMVDKVNPRAPFRLQMPTNIEQMNQHYSVQSVTDDRVAGMDAQRVELAPRDEFRYGRTYWLASNSGLLLRAALLDEQGKTIEQMMFTELKLQDRIPVERFESQTGGKDYVWQRHVEDNQIDSEHSQWFVEQLPAGFVREAQRRYRLTEQGGEVEHMMFSDGLSSISVFVEPHEGDGNPFIGSSRMGALSAYALLAGGHRITVMGEVPMATVKMIAGAIRSRAAND